jgi:hypothetical protein
VTGVAPWRVPSRDPAAVASRLPSVQQQRRHRSSSDTAAAAPAADPAPDPAAAERQLSGAARLLAYARRCCGGGGGSGEADADAEGPSADKSWTAALAAPSPTLLPALRFHDLVFGHSLGSGGFGSVRYARRVTPGRPQAAWPEYAVKCVSLPAPDDAAGPGCRTRVERELALLRLATHPGVARLVSAFLCGGAAYMVLEYAAEGDLHTLVTRRGPSSDCLTD